MPRYDFYCPLCGKIVERFVAYADFDQVKREGYKSSCVSCDDQEVMMTMVFSGEMPGVHLKGYGFTKTDNRSADERFMFDHYDGSGRNSEMKAIERRIKHPESSLPLKPNTKKG